MMEGETYRDCPKCGEECSSLDSFGHWDQEPYYASVVFSFKCKECGCKFTLKIETTETMEWKDEDETEDDSDAIQKAEQEMEEKFTMAMLHQREGTYG